jgi:hypothetical protein
MFSEETRALDSCEAGNQDNKKWFARGWIAVLSEGAILILIETGVECGRVAFRESQ